MKYEGVYVWLLWGSDTEVPWVEGVYANKVEAKSDLRLLKESDDGRGYIYWIEERPVY